MSFKKTLENLKVAGWTPSYTISEDLRQKLKAMRYAEAYGATRPFITDVEKSYMENCKRLQQYYNAQLVQEMGIPAHRMGESPFDLDALRRRKLELERQEVYEKMRAQLLAQQPTWIIHGHIHDKKEDKMKTKKFYHTFEFKEREITLCLLVKYNAVEATIETGYAVKVPEDRKIEGLSKKIALGRAEKGVLLDDRMDGHTEYLTSLPILKGIALHYEKQVKRGFLTIKGIRPKKSVNSQEEEE